jgi:hypothetical protein
MLLKALKISTMIASLSWASWASTVPEQGLAGPILSDNPCVPPLPAHVGWLIGYQTVIKTKQRSVNVAQAALAMETVDPPPKVLGWVIIDQFGQAWVILNQGADRKTATWFHMAYGDLPEFSPGVGRTSHTTFVKDFSVPKWLQLVGCSGQAPK